MPEIKFASRKLSAGRITVLKFLALAAATDGKRSRYRSDIAVQRKLADYNR